MATAPVRNKSAEEELLERLDKKLDDAAEQESHRTFIKRTKKAIANLRSAIFAHSRRRGTA